MFFIMRNLWSMADAIINEREIIINLFDINSFLAVKINAKLYSRENVYFSI